MFLFDTNVISESGKAVANEDADGNMGLELLVAALG
jgi:hypothetical protein